MKQNQTKITLKEMVESGLRLPEFMELLEIDLIEEALNSNEDNKVQTALMLGIPRPTLIHKLRNSQRLKNRVLKANQKKVIA